MLHVLYLVHDLSDPATSRRVAMLKAGGAAVSLAGFHRDREPAREVAGERPVGLGRTHDGRFAQRLAAIAGANLALGPRFRHVSKPDVIIARNLEMLVFARRLCAQFGGDIPIVYECLDVHRLLLRRDGIGLAMRAAERALGGTAALLITSSPAFLREYFAPRGQIGAPVLLLENKVLELGPVTKTAAQNAPVPGAPWRIGWFGALRCRRSLALLSAFTRRMQGTFEVVLRGRPAYSEFDDFDATVAAEPHMRFEGAYRNPDDLAAIYGTAHFAWAIDFFEEGLNSKWLLPNRLYEGCRHGAVPIGMDGTETGRFLDSHGIGALLAEPSANALTALLGSVDAASYTDHRARVAAKPDNTWICGPADCRALVGRLEGLTRARADDKILEAAA
ncbi:glycosyl transferase family 1 [Chelativorans sp. M5D2P16]|uniref:glycosyl transferase family 1 n=1 Tax=Chelativorans sp. M5D2P16 TaxID=3095678 RepID=UPI002ACA4E2B|nr:glycosyl transferase family 1 [Chelativorans sp. M5D2P16]MDZ5696127.1 glycosyl transferase family 1 [Chelativorans sp. M5D2P16]